MKKINKYIAAGLITLSVASSCKKIDSLHPYNAIDVSQAFQTVKDAGSWDVGNYNILRGRVYGEYMYGTDVQSDVLNATLDYGNNGGSEHKWGSFFLASDYLIQDYWEQFYVGIANVNVAIAGFKTIPVTSSSDQALMNQYTGDAYLSRAYYYLGLIQRFAKPYEASTANSPGVPLVLTYDPAFKAKPARATIKQVYDQIISDITTAENLLVNVPGAQGSNYYTIDAAIALEARARLNMQDWAGAYAAANKLITSNKYPLISDATTYKNYWATDGTQEDIVQLYVKAPDQEPLTNNYYLGYVASTKSYDPLYVPSQWVVDKFADNDIRKDAFFLNAPVNIHAVSGTLYLVNKYPGNPSLWTSAVSNYANAPKLFRIAEMYLIAAEAAANSSNTAGALSALNALRVARGIGAVNVSGADLTNAIRDERFRELAFEGFRLEDLKRWHLGFTRHAPQNTNFIVTGSNYDSLTIPADDNKFVWGIPSNDITTNTNLTQNPGW